MRGASLLHRLADASAQEPSCGYLWGVRVRRVFMPSRMRQGRHAMLVAQAGAASRLVCNASVRSTVVAAASPGRKGLVCGSLVSIQITIYTGVQQACCAMVEFGWDGARRGRAHREPPAVFDRRGRDKAMGVGSSASWDKGVLLVCARCSRQGGAARTGLGVRARRQYKPAAEIHVRARTRALTSTPRRTEWDSMRVCTNRENSSGTDRAVGV